MSLLRSAWKNANLDPRSLWYAPTPRIRTKTAARRALALADWITTGCESRNPPDEQECFIALHTCAFQAARPERGKPIPAAHRRRWARRWECIREYIVMQNLGLVYTMIARFHSKDLDHDDLLSEAMFALSRAVDRFNPWRGFRFSTYACNVIGRALMRRGKIQARYRRFFAGRAEEPLEPMIRSEGGEEFYVERLRRAMKHNLGGLTRMEREVIAHRFPPNTEGPRTFRQIGKLVGLSKERVRQIQNVALGKLRDALDADPLLS